MFIATKLFLPPIQPGLVSRPRLFDVLDDAWNTGQRLILLSAPPGYGKTTLLSEWIAVQDTPAIWLALDDKDNDPVRFFQYMLLALKQHAPGLEELLSTLNTLHAANLEILITEVINQLVQTRSRSCLCWMIIIWCIIPKTMPWCNTCLTTSHRSFIWRLFPGRTRPLIWHACAPAVRCVKFASGI